MRLFFALWPDEVTRRGIGRAFRKAIRHSGGKPVPSENLHLTLAFLGSVDTDLLPIVEKAAGSVPVQSFNLPLDRLGYFPRARSLWVGPSEPPPSLTGLEDGLWKALAGAGFQRGSGVFRPHVTLVRKGRAVADQPGTAIHWPVREFVLVRSDTLQAGARYTVLKRWSANPR